MEWQFVCQACGAETEATDPYPSRCPAVATAVRQTLAGGDESALDDREHLLIRRVAPGPDSGPPVWPAAAPRDIPGEVSGDGDGGEAVDLNPFVRYRTLLHVYSVARGSGITDGDYLRQVHALDDAVDAVDGHRLQRTPFLATSRDGAGAGIWVKYEAGGVAGSHKARHLFGLLLYLQLKLGATEGIPDASAPLAIASCGNAALAAAVLARAVERELCVFVPPGADPQVLSRLRGLRARVIICPRIAGEAGDPCYLRLRDALAEGAVAFTCQARENGLTVEGGRTLAYELADDCSAAGIEPDHLVVQVGGGALLGSVYLGLKDAVALGRLRRLPKIHAVQPESVHPLERAYHRLRARLSDSSPASIDDALQFAVRHRSEFMWPWEDVRPSVASGILDDETYDWSLAVRAMLETAGEPVVVSEDRLRVSQQHANAILREETAASGLAPVDATGAAGLAGALALRESGVIGDHETTVVLFTGAQR